MNTRTWSSRAILIGTLAALATGGLGLASSAQAQGKPTAEPPAPPAAPVTLPVGPRPESITKGWGGKFFVSIQGAPTVGLNDGEIRTLDLTTGATTTFVTGLDNPRGITFTGKFLVVTDTTVVWIIERSGAKRILAGPSAFPHPVAFFNDAAAEDGGRAVYVSEMGSRTLMRDPATGRLWPTDSPQALAIPPTSRVYRITLTGKVSEAVTPSRRVLVMNGVEPTRHGHLLCAEFFYGNIVDVDLRTNSKRVIATGFRAMDGIAQGRDGTIYGTSFDNGTIFKMDRDGENPQVLVKDLGFQSVADLYLDEGAKRVLVPDTLHGTVVVVPLS
jgi:sugar lactone lactonase YvrE